MAAVIHIHQTAELAERVLLPGDPGRALRLAQRLLEQPKMLNHNRGLWGYTGTAADGALLSIQSTGMGGPSAAVIASELVELGARRLLRIGTCGGLDPQLHLGQPLVVTEAIADDGTSSALGGHAPLQPVLAPGTLTRALLDAAADPDHAAQSPPATSGPIVSTDLFYDAEDRVDTWIARGARAVEMETATIFTLAARRGVEAGCVLLVSNLLTVGNPDYIDEAGLHDAELTLGRLALAAISAS
jgi:DeoD family purine-nucleoside phosphorylase